MTATELRKTLTIGSATALAKEYGDEDFTTAIDAARTAGIHFFNDTATTENDITTISVDRPKGLMIAWKPNQWDRDLFSIPGGEECDQIHLTLLYFGDADEFDLEQQRTIIAVAHEVAQKHTRLNLRVNGFGRFVKDGEEDEPLWLGIEGLGLRELQGDLATALTVAGIEFRTDHEFNPHITVAWIDPEKETPAVTVQPAHVVMDNLTIYIGGIEYPISLQDVDYTGEELASFESSKPSLYVPDLQKSHQGGFDEEKRFSYGAWYVPDSLDAHNEWATADDVQTALWKYVDSGDRDIRLQHDVDIRAGRWVELATFPFPVSVPIETEFGMQKHTYPAGTPFMGTIWDEWAWPLVKSGALRGFSVGGSAQRVLADFPSEMVKAAGVQPTARHAAAPTDEFERAAAFADSILELEKSIDGPDPEQAAWDAFEIVSLSKANPHHGSGGRFSSGPGGGSTSTKTAKPKTSKVPKNHLASADGTTIHKTKAAEKMYGTGSPQHLAAKKKWGSG